MKILIFSGVHKKMLQYIWDVVKMFTFAWCENIKHRHPHREASAWVYREANVWGEVTSSLTDRSNESNIEVY